MNRVVVIGLDGATFDLITPWLQKGRLPTFERLIREGVYGEMESVIQPITAPAWASFLTGKNPGKHGVYDFYRREPGSYNMRPVNRNRVMGKVLYELLSEGGKKVGMINVPLTYPPRPVNGFVITGMMTPPGASFTYPPELKGELLGGDYKVELDTWYKPGKEKEYFEELKKVLHGREEALSTLMESHPWDFLMCVFRATDLVQHHFWKFSDPHHPDFDEEGFHRCGGYIYQVYHELDEFLARIVGRMDDSTTLFLISDHGFGRERKMVHLNNWLHRVGLLHFKGDPKTRLKRFLFESGFTPNNILRVLTSLNLQRVFFRVSKEAKSKVFANLLLSYADVDWSRTQAYTRGQFGQVYLNVKGREPRGIVDADSEYFPLREKIIGALMELRDPEDGEGIVERCYRKEEIYWGDMMGAAPDILIKWKDMEYVAYEVISGGKALISPNPDIRSGGHRMNGIFTAYGPEIVKGAEVKGISIMDVAPTVLHMLGVPIPSDTDGKVLKAIFREDSRLFSEEIIYEESEQIPVREGPGLSEEEMEEIRERLRGLGYL